MKRKAPASEALVSLRKAMEKTQTDFAVGVLKCAISTLARYETSDPPRGEVLLKLADIAARNQHSVLADTFRRIYLDEVFEKFGDSITVTGGSGYLLMKLNTQEEAAAALRFQNKLEEMRGQRDEGFVHSHQKQLEAFLLTRIGKKDKRK